MTKKKDEIPTKLLYRLTFLYIRNGERIGQKDPFLGLNRDQRRLLLTQRRGCEAMLVAC